MPEYVVKSLAKALRLLRSLSTSSEPLGPAELSLEHDLHLRNVVRLLGTLEREGFLARLPSGKYQPSSDLVVMLSHWSHLAPPVTATRHALNRLRDATGETAVLLVRSGLMRTVVGSVQSRALIRSAPEPGQAHPLLTGSTGYVLLSDAGPHEFVAIRSAIAQRFGSAAVMPDEEEEAVMLGQLHRNGYLIRGMEDLERMASAPVRGANGAVVAALGVTGPSARWTLHAAQRQVDRILMTAAELSSAMQSSSAIDRLVWNLQIA